MVSKPALTRALRQRLGLRRPDLPVVIGSDIKRKWHIWDRDVPAAVQAKAIWQCEYCLSRLIDEDSWEWDVVRAAYNTIPDPTLNKLNLLERLDWALEKVKPPKSRRTAERLLEKLDVDLTRLLQGDLPEPLLPAPAPERAGTLLRAIIPAVHGLAWESAIDAFLSTDVHVPVSPAGKVIAGTTSTRGRWVCAFTSRNNLIEFQQVTQPSWAGDVRVVMGATLVTKVHKADYYAGLMIDPPARKNGITTQALGIGALQLAIIASTIA